MFVVETDKWDLLDPSTVQLVEGFNTLLGQVEVDPRLCLGPVETAPRGLIRR